MRRIYPNLSEDENEERILSNIRQYRNNRKLLCLECGYEGVMGSLGKANIVLYILNILASLFVFFVLLLFGMFGFIIGLVIVFVILKSGSNYYFCSNFVTFI